MDFLKQKAAMLEDDFSRITTLGEENNNIIDRLCVLLLALTPILQHYKGIYVELSVCVLVLLAPYLGIKFLLSARKIRIPECMIVLPLILYKAYGIIAQGTNFMEIAYTLVISFYFVVGVAGCLNIKKFIKYGYYIAMAASILIIIQYVCFYIFGFHLQLVATSLLLPESEMWIGGAKTGLISITGRPSSFYRPSAFFLEPSHMFLYLFPQLFVVLLSLKKRTWKLVSGIIITIGLICSTSGMGILVAFGAWGLYLACTDGEENVTSVKYLFRKRNIAVVSIYLVFCFALYSTVPVIENSINRIFVGQEREVVVENPEGGEVIVETETGSTAIEGRTKRASKIIAEMSDKELVFGVEEKEGPIKANMPGFMRTLYNFGFVGIVLSYCFYVSSFLKLRYHNVWIAFIVLLVSFFSAHTHGTFFMLYYVYILLGGWRDAKNPYKLKDVLAQCIKKKGKDI